MTLLSTANQMAPDGLLALITEFRNDPSPNKIDLGVGVYQNEEGKTPIFEAVKKAHHLLSEVEESKAYVGPLGFPGFADEAKKLILDDELMASLGDRFVVIPTPGSNGALRLAGELMKRINPSAAVWLGRPTWVNHKPIFTACNLETKDFAYYDRENNCLDRENLHAELEVAKSGDLVVLHGCCHNPSGEDLNSDDWARFTDLSNEKGVLPLIDVAYHGLGLGFEEDMVQARKMLSSVPEALVTYSFSKNLGLYRERVGVIGALAETPEIAQRIQSNITEIARKNYSMPPSYGEALAYFTLSNADLRENWLSELAVMRARVNGLREQLTAALSDTLGHNQLAYIKEQKGMFSLLPLTSAQIQTIKSEHSIYMAPDGRVNICGFTPEKIARFAEVVAKVAK